MPFSIRKSVNVGPLRYNLSTSGIGVSTGVKGFSVGYGPRGNYVHMGAGGLYYRRTLPPPKSPRAEQTSDEYDEPADSHEPLEAIESGNVSRMIDTSSAQLLCELNEKRRRIRLWPIVCAAAIAVTVTLLVTRSSYWLTVPVALLGVIATIATYVYDISKKCVVIMYDLNGPVHEGMQSVYASLSKLSQSGGKWRLAAQGNVHDPKYHAGAGKLIRRQPLSISTGEPPFVRTNIEVFRLAWDQRTLYFLPDRVLVYENDQIGAVSYDGLRLHISSTQFIEEERVPHDAQVVDHTWRYVNKSGAPDKRFNNNKQIPVCRYEVLNLEGSNGLNEIFHISNVGAGESLKATTIELTTAIRAAQQAEKERQLLAAERARLRPTESPFDARQTTSAPQKGPPPLPQVSSGTVAALHVLCCVMVADGTASRRERVYIHKQMRAIDARWDRAQIDAEIDKFINDIRSVGGKHLLQQTISQVPMIKRDGLDAAVVNSLNGLISADDNVDERELILCSRFEKLLTR